MSTLDEKVKARRATRWAIESGALVRLPCNRCGAGETIAHHHDYAAPLDVEWLCRTCHSAHHRKHAVTKSCEACGADYAPHRTKRARQKTCSPACRQILVTAAVRARTQSAEGREAARRLAFATGAADRARTMVLARWGKP